MMYLEFGHFFKVSISRLCWVCAFVDVDLDTYEDGSEENLFETAMWQKFSAAISIPGYELTLRESSWGTPRLPFLYSIDAPVNEIENLELEIDGGKSN